jgi:hypothetical protein
VITRAEEEGEDRPGLLHLERLVRGGGYGLGGKRLVDEGIDDGSHREGVDLAYRDRDDRGVSFRSGVRVERVERVGNFATAPRACRARTTGIVTAAPALPPCSPRRDGVGFHHVEHDGLFRFAPSVAVAYLGDEGVPGAGCFAPVGVGAPGAALR